MVDDIAQNNIEHVMDAEEEDMMASDTVNRFKRRSTRKIMQIYDLINVPKPNLMMSIDVSKSHDSTKKLRNSTN